MKKWVAGIALGAMAWMANAANMEELKKQVADTERAFAATMKARDLAGFASFVSDEAVFFWGPDTLRGKAAVVERWKQLYEGKEAPFSWEPDRVEVLDSGTLALSVGPVYNATGKLQSRFNSIWRLENGKWKIIFDKGEPLAPARN